MDSQKLVEVKYQAGHPEILGPYQLVMKTELIISSVLAEFQGKISNSAMNQEMNNRIDRLYASEGWYVLCGITGERIPFGQLRYWSVEKQIAYAGPEVSLRDHTTSP